MTQVNLDLARQNMIEQQIRPWEVLNQQVLDTFSAIPREQFVPEAWRNMAFTDFSIPLDHGQVMMPPRLEGRFLQAIEVQPFESVLEVGTGSGYLTAALASLAKHVYSVDLHADFIERAAKHLAANNLNNVTLEQGDAANGWDAHGPYDVIVLTGSVPELPAAFRNALRIGGRLIAVVGGDPIMEVILVTHGDEQQWSREALFETDLPPLENVTHRQAFVF